MSAAELTAILQEIVLQLGEVMSFGLGALTALAFVIAAHTRWF